MSNEVTLSEHLTRIGALGRGVAKVRGDSEYYKELAAKALKARGLKPSKKKKAQAA